MKRIIAVGILLAVLAGCSDRTRYTCLDAPDSARCPEKVGQQ